MIGIIIAAIALAAILVPGQWALRRDMADLRKDIEVCLLCESVSECVSEVRGVIAAWANDGGGLK